MQTVLRVVGVVFLAAYPVVVYVGITHWNLGAVAVLSLLVLIPTLSIRYRNRTGEHLAAVFGVPLAVLAVSIFAALMDDRRLILALPVVVNAVLLVYFAGSLRGPIPVVERLARLQQPELSPSEVRYCRSVTWLWVSFFVVNGLVAGVLAVIGPLSLWAVYTGPISYLLIGVVFAAEFVVRRARFQHFGSGLHDRILKWICRKQRRAFTRAK
jgi:uncharacterized membrane protein